MFFNNKRYFQFFLVIILIVSVTPASASLTGIIENTANKPYESDISCESQVDSRINELQCYI